MELRQLEYYVAVVQHGSILQAASALNLSQPPLSVAMKQLEQELGTPLFFRGARRIQLTAAGERFYQRALDILSLTEDTRREITGYAQGQGGVLRLGAVSSSAASLLYPRLFRFAARHPKMRYQIDEGNTFEQLNKLAAGLIEAAIVRTPIYDASVHVLELDADPLAVVVRRETDQFPDDQITIRQLKDQPLVYYRRFAALLAEECEKEGFTPSPLCLNDDARTSIQWAQAGLGTAIVPYSSAGFIDLTQMSVKPIACERLVTKTCLIWSKKRPLSAATALFLDFLRQDSKVDV